MGKKKKGKGESFVKLTRHMLGHPAWLDLSTGARCIYIEIRKRYNGNNNGEIHLSCREAGENAKCGKNTASKLFKELQEHGFIKESIKGRFRNKWASTWILTNEEYGGHHKTDEWVKWQPKEKNAVPVMRLKVPTDVLKRTNVLYFSTATGTKNGI